MVHVEAVRAAYDRDALGVMPAWDVPEYPDLDWNPQHTDRRQGVDAVRIIDGQGGGQYIVTARDNGDAAAELVAVWLRAPIRGALADGTFSGVRWMNDAELAARAVAFTRRRASWRERQHPGALRLGLDYAERDDATNPQSRPALEQVAAEVHLATNAGYPIATWISEQYRVSPATAWRWIRAARTAGHLPPPKAGRPRKTTTEENR